MFCFTLNFPNAELSVLETDLNLIAPVDDLFNRSDRFRGQSDWSFGFRVHCRYSPSHIPTYNHRPYV